MLSDTRVLAMTGMLVTLVARLSLPRHQPGRPQPTVLPARRSDAERRGDRQPDGLPVPCTGTELSGSSWKG